MYLFSLQAGGEVIWDSFPLEAGRLALLKENDRRNFELLLDPYRLQNTILELGVDHFPVDHLLPRVGFG